jgi:hypothetical protein
MIIDIVYNMYANTMGRTDNDGAQGLKGLRNDEQCPSNNTWKKNGFRCDR